MAASSLSEESPSDARAGISGGRVGVNGTCGACESAATVAGVEFNADDDIDADDGDRGAKKDAGIDLAGLRRDDGDR